MNIADIQKHKRFVENGNYADIRLEKLADRYTQQNDQSISYLDILFSSSRVESMSIDGVAYKCVVDYSRTSKVPTNSEPSLTREIWTVSSDSIKAGTILGYSVATGTSDLYLLLRNKETRDGYDLGVMQKCSSSLKWLDSERNIIEAHFAFTREFSPSLGIENGKIINLGKEIRNIVIPSNSNTLLFNKGRRFIFDNRCWIVSAIDTLSTVGLIHITLEESTIDPAKDNVELRIADYYPIPDTTPESPPTPPVSDVLITGADYIRQGSTVSYSITEPVTWALMNEQETSTTNYAVIVSHSEIQCSVKANKNGIGYVILRATLQDGFTVSKKIQIKTNY